MLRSAARLAILCLFFVGQAHAQHAYSTNFSAAENPISEAGVWSNGAANGLDWCDVQKMPGLAFGNCSKSFRDPTAVLNNNAGGTGAWGPNQQAQATVFVGTFTGVVYPEVELRLNTTITEHSITGYEIDYTVGTAANHPNPNLAIVRWNGPVLVNPNDPNDPSFTVLAQANGVIVHNGDVVMAYNINGHICAFINDTFILDAVDTTYRNGSPGIGFNYNEGAQYNQGGFTSFSATDSPDTSWFEPILPRQSAAWPLATFLDGLSDDALSPYSTILRYSSSEATLTNALANCTSTHRAPTAVPFRVATSTLSNGINFSPGSIAPLVLHAQQPNPTQPNFFAPSSGCLLTASTCTSNDTVANATPFHLEAPKLQKLPAPCLQSF